MWASRGINPPRHCRHFQCMAPPTPLIGVEVSGRVYLGPNVAQTLWKRVYFGVKCNELTLNHTTHATNVRNPTIGRITQTPKTKSGALLKYFVGMKLINLMSFFQTDDVRQSSFAYTFTHTDGWVLQMFPGHRQQFIFTKLYLIEVWL